MDRLNGIRVSQRGCEEKKKRRETHAIFKKGRITDSVRATGSGHEQERKPWKDC